MRFLTTFAADFDDLKVHHYEDNNQRVSTVTLQIGVTDKEATGLFGPAFFATVFGPMGEKEDEDGNKLPSFPFDSMKPNGTWEHQPIKIDGLAYACQPSWGVIKPVQGEAKVIVTIKLPLLTNTATSIGKLGMLTGSVVEVVPMQTELPLGEAA